MNKLQEVLALRIEADAYSLEARAALMRAEAQRIRGIDATSAIRTASSFQQSAESKYQDAATLAAGGEL